MQYHLHKHMVSIAQFDRVVNGVPDLLTLSKRIEASDLYLDFLELQFTAEAGLGNYKRAYSITQEFNTRNDSLFSDQLSKDLAEMNAKYENEIKEKENESLRAESAERILAIALLEKKARRRQWTSALLGLLTLVVISIGYFWRKSSQQANIILAQSTQIKDQQLETLRIDKELSSMQAMFDGEEKERKRIASDLHDAIGGMLSSIKLQLGKN